MLLTFPLFGQCNFAVNENIGDKLYLYTETTEFIQQSNENNKLDISVGIEGYDNYIVILELGLEQKVKTAVKEEVIFYFDEIEPLVLTEFQDQDKAFITNLSDAELNTLYDHDIVNIEFVFNGNVHTFDLKSNDRSKHVDLIDCLDNRIKNKEGISTESNIAPAEKIFKVVESMPRFPGCEDEFKTTKERERCAKEEMLVYIYKNLKYPGEARKNKVEGTVVIQFVIDADGIIQDANILRDIGDGCGESALLVINGMNDLPEPWTPGMQKGKQVKVLYTLPIKFKLGG